MAPEPEKPNRLASADEFGRVLSAYVFALIGAGLAVFIVVFGAGDDPSVRIAGLVIAASMMGRVIAASVAQIISAWRRHE